MRGLRLQILVQLLAGTAMALVLAAPAAAAPEEALLLDESDLSRFVAPDTGALSFRGTMPAGDASAAQAVNPIIGEVRDAIAGAAFERLVPRLADREALASFYQRQDAPLWFTAAGPTARAEAAAARLRDADADGLDPRDYPVPEPSARDARTLAEAEITLAATLLTYARHASKGRVHFSRVSADIEYDSAFEPEAALRALAASDDVARTLAGFNPTHPGYLALKTKLAELRRAPPDNRPPRLAGGAVLRISQTSSTTMADPRVPALRALLGVAAEPNLNYDASLAAAVVRFQEAHGLTPTGQLDAATVEAFDGPRRSRQIEAILATMERWRWLPRDLGRTRVVLNIPDYTLRVFHDGAQVWQTRIVAGKPTSPTPLLSQTIKSITVNPTWNVPQSIIRNELLPVYQSRDPEVFARLGLRVERNRDGSLRVSQPPGERNALGRIRFNFPNRYLVYQHDTPEKQLFSLTRRALSHGCMRVQEPAKYAAVLLSYGSPELRLSEARIQAMFGGTERQIDLHSPVPLHVTYQTAFVDEQGKLQLRDDIYGLDAKILSLLGTGERATAGVPARPARPGPVAVRRPIPGIAGAETGGRDTLFDRIFR